MSYSGKVLVVDDSKLINSFIVEILSNNNFLTISAYSGDEALQLLKSDSPDLILLDIVLPDITGFEVYSEIHKDDAFKDIPVIFLTGVSDADNIKKGLELGAIDYIPKPFKEIELTLKIINHFKTINANKLLKERELKLEEYSKELEELNSTKNNFFSIISHDLRNPFNTLLGFSELLQESLENDENEKAKYFAQVINNTLELTYSLLDNILEWANFERGKIAFNPQPACLREIMDENINLVRSMAIQKEVSVENLCANETTVYADKHLITVIIRNLLTNALKYTHTLGKIKIKAIPNEDYVEIRISDNGVGMSDETKSKLFRMTDNVSKLGTAMEKGSGLGLVLCKDFVEMHQGRIWVESELGNGSTFIFTIPVKSQNQEVR